MSTIANPFNQHRSSGLPETAAAIKLWTCQALALTDESIVSVSEFACAKPTCPNQQVVILVMSQGRPTRKISIHKSIADVSEFDVLDACLDLLRNSSS
jgi:hypothetical protein